MHPRVWSLDCDGEMVETLRRGAMAPGLQSGLGERVVSTRAMVQIGEPLGGPASWSKTCRPQRLLSARSSSSATETLGGRRRKPPLEMLFMNGSSMVCPLPSGCVDRIAATMPLSRPIPPTCSACGAQRADAVGRGTGEEEHPAPEPWPDH